MAVANADIINNRTSKIKDLADGKFSLHNLNPMKQMLIYKIVRPLAIDDTDSIIRSFHFELQKN